MSPHRAQLLSLLALLAFLAGWLVFLSQHQPRISLGDGRGDDGVAYGQMAEQFLAGQPLAADAPFVYRMGVPWLAAQWARALGVPVDQAFFLLNLLAVFLLGGLVYRFALRYCSPTFALLVGVFYFVPWFSRARALFFYPVQVDTVWVALAVASLLLMAPPLNVRKAMLLTLTTLAAVLVRETGLLLPAAFFLAQYRRQQDLRLPALLVALAGAALLATRLIGASTNGFSFPAAVFESVRDNLLPHLALSAYLAFGGPLLAFLVLERSRLVQWYRHSPADFYFVAFVLILTEIGGGATLRFMTWAAPVVLAWIGMALEHSWPRLDLGGRFLAAIALCGALWLVHPLEGFYPDYSAWVQWGGVQRLSQTTLLYGLIVLATTLPALALLGRRALSLSVRHALTPTRATPEY